MKTKKLLWMSGMFMAGALAGFFLMGLFSFRSPSNPALPTLTVKQANACFKNSNKSGSLNTNAAYGFTLDKADLTAMSNLLTSVPALSGFRIYCGYDTTTNTRIGIIVAIDNTGTSGSDLTNTIYSAPATRLGPCPPVCDVNSPITH
jgi:hypothetical protein